MIHLINKTGWLSPSLSPWVSAYSCSWILHHSFIGPLHHYLCLFYYDSLLLHPSTVKTSYLPAPVCSRLFFFPIPVCGCEFVSFSLLGMTRRNLRAAGEFSSYPSALKPQHVYKAKTEREREKECNKEDENERKTTKR